jgi:hypothetical protein
MPVIGWLERNKEWLLSGIGVTVLVALYAGGRRAITAWRDHSKPAPPPFDQVKFRTHPLPGEITRQINEAPLLHQANRSREFLGIRVQWLTTLSNADIRGSGIRLMLKDRGMYPWVYVTVPTDLYPDLSLAKEGTLVWVAGTIAEFSGGGIVLEQVELRIAV